MNTFPHRRILWICLGSALLLTACAPREATVQHDRPTATELGEQGARKASDYQGSGPLGTKTNPLKCDGNSGAEAYLQNLRGPRGQVIQWEEMGSGGVGPFGGLLYIYKVTYPSPQGPVEESLFFDTTFEGIQEHRAASGFTLGHL